MLRRFAVRLRSLLPLLLLILLAACRTSPRTYDVRGRIVGFSDDPRTVIVTHEDVPGLMPAMTMPFKSRDAAEVDGLPLGQAVRFTLAVSRDSAWIYDVERLPDDALPSAEAPVPGSTGAVTVLQPGDILPPFDLVAQDGSSVRPSHYRGQALLVTFIYTRCPIPDYCPLMMRQFRALQDTLTQRFGDRVHLLGISFDPAHDTPEVLRAYGARYGAEPEHWTLATGAPAEVERVTRLFGVHVVNPGAEEISHTLATALIGPDGKVREIWRGNEWTTEAVSQSVARVLDDGPATAAR